LTGAEEQHLRGLAEHDPAVRKLLKQRGELRKENGELMIEVIIRDFLFAMTFEEMRRKKRGRDPSNEERDRKILRLRDEGRTFGEIADEVNKDPGLRDTEMDKESVRKVVERGRERRRQNEAWERSPVLSASQLEEELRRLRGGDGQGKGGVWPWPDPVKLGLRLPNGKTLLVKLKRWVPNAPQPAGGQND
jgi:hypothetical protein